MKTLRQYLNDHQLGVVEMSEQIGQPQSTCSMWVLGKRIPSKENMQKIHEWSGGEVEPNDFYDLGENEND